MNSYKRKKHLCVCVRFHRNIHVIFYFMTNTLSLSRDWREWLLYARRRTVTVNKICGISSLHQHCENSSCHFVI